MEPDDDKIFRTLIAIFKFGIALAWTATVQAREAMITAQWLVSE